MSTHSSQVSSVTPTTHISTQHRLHKSNASQQLKQVRWRQSVISRKCTGSCIILCVLIQYIYLLSHLKMLPTSIAVKLYFACTSIYYIESMKICLCLHTEFFLQNMKNTNKSPKCSYQYNRDCPSL